MISARSSAEEHAVNCFSEHQSVLLRRHIHLHTHPHHWDCKDTKIFIDLLVSRPKTVTATGLRKLGTRMKPNNDGMQHHSEARPNQCHSEARCAGSSEPGRCRQVLADVGRCWQMLALIYRRSAMGRTGPYGPSYPIVRLLTLRTVYTFF